MKKILKIIEDCKEEIIVKIAANDVSENEAIIHNVSEAESKFQ